MAEIRMTTKFDIGDLVKTMDGSILTIQKIFATVIHDKGCNIVYDLGKDYTYSEDALELVCPSYDRKDIWNA
jgi:hypothetical protein